MLRKIQGTNKVLAFYVNNAKTIQPVKYTKQQYKMYPAVFLSLGKVIFPKNFSDLIHKLLLFQQEIFKAQNL